MATDTHDEEAYFAYLNKAIQTVAANPGIRFDQRTEEGRAMHKAAHHHWVKGQLQWLGEENAAASGRKSGWYVKGKLPPAQAGAVIEAPDSMEAALEQHRREKTRAVPAPTADAPPMIGDAGGRVMDIAPGARRALEATAEAKKRERDDLRAMVAQAVAEALRDQQPAKDAPRYVTLKDIESAIEELDLLRESCAGKEAASGYEISAFTVIVSHVCMRHVAEQIDAISKLHP